ncbi:MAG: SAM-dependent DNA methyltransferase [Actinobacteria bacterium]|nr:MAG: SAM-dependent DNA methyltransferase [Actinomycetota bacterium]
MARREEFVAVHSEGGLLPAALLGRIAALDGDLDAIGAEAYYLAAGEKLNDAVTRSWNRILGLWESITESLLADGKDLSAGDTRRQLLLPLFQELGYGHLEISPGLSFAGRSYPISHLWQHVPIHLLGTATDLDRRSPGVAGAAQASPHGLVQELLNRSDHHLWAIVANGRTLRLLRDNASLTRQAYLEFDLETILDGQHYADFRLLWLVAHASRLDAEIPEKCVLEQWRLDAQQQGARALDQLRDGVEKAIEELGTGFVAHPGNSDLRAALQAGELHTVEYYRQLLRVVYRVIFLLVAESRDLLHPPDVDPTASQRYRDHYSIQRLRTLARRRGGGPHSDLWAGLQVVFAALGHSAGLPALGLPALGSALWASETTKHLNRAQLANRHLLAAIRALTTVIDGRVVHLVDYRNLGAEELGSIYESLLEQHPEIDLPARHFTLATAAGNERKTTGSYYTPTSLIDQLLDTALDPVLDQAASAADPEQAILALTVLDPACGSGHFLIAAAHRISQRLAGVRSGEDEPAPGEVRAALRDVIGRCIHGIDVNPMAVELCKVNLWLEAMTPGKPLSFLDHRIVCGNALLGVTPRLLDEGVPDDAFKPITGDDNEVVKSLKKSNKQALTERAGQLTFDLTAAQLAKPLADAVAAVDAIGDDDPADIEAKEQLWAEQAGSDEAERARLAADAWCAAFVAKKVTGAPVITDRVVRAIASNPASVDADVLAEIRRLRDEYRFLHPHLAFPHVFRAPDDGEGPDNAKTGWSGGFSVVLGNPPWERVKLQEKEFFAARAPEIAEAPNASARKRMIKALQEDDPALLKAYEAAVRQADGWSHLLRDSGRYPLCGRGDVNTYTVFAEAMRDAVGPTGRAGIVVPTGIATDDTTKHFFADLVGQQSIVSLFGFYDRGRLFPGADVHNFCLLTMAGTGVRIDKAEFVFFAHDVADLFDPERRFLLAPEDFELLNPNTRTCPVFRTRRDAEITKEIYQRVPVLIRAGDPDGNPWGVQLATMFHMSNDSYHFRTHEQLSADGWQLVGNVFRRGAERCLPLCEAKMIHHFDHRWATFEGHDIRDCTAAEKRDPSFVVQPRYWVHESAVLAVGGQLSTGWFVGFRDICRATDERTMIAAVFPAAAVSNKLPLILSIDDRAYLLPVILSSLAHDFVARQKIGSTTMNFFIAHQLAVIPPSTLRERAAFDDRWTLSAWLSQRVLELVYSSWDMQPVTRDIGFTAPPFVWDDDRRALLRAELDACFFHLYGIGRDDVDYIMETFPVVKRRDIAEHGEFRTKRLILEVYDAMGKAIETGEPYQTILDPPPADPSLCHDPATRPDWADEYLR